MLIDWRAYPRSVYGELESAGTDPRPGANHPSPTTSFTDLWLQECRVSFTMPAAALYHAWLVLNDGVPAIETDRPVLQQADETRKSNVYHTQDCNLSNRTIEEAVCTPKACYPGIRKRGELVWYCVSRRPHTLCRICADYCRVLVMTGQ